MARVLITGGRGVLGSQIGAMLRERGYTVRIMSRSRSRLEPGSKLEWAQAQLATGEGLAAAVSGVDTIVHCATSAFKETYKVDVLGTKALLEQAAQAGVGHFLYISIVGIDRVPFSYYQHKLAAERIIEASRVPWTILRATQFHTLIDTVLNGIKRFPIWLLPTDFQFQVLDPGEVAAHMVSLVEAGPSGRVADLGGPEVLRLGAMADVWKQAQGIRRPVIRLPLPGKVAHGFRSGYNTCPQNRFGKITWGEWVQRRYRSQAMEASQSERVKV